MHTMSAEEWRDFVARGAHTGKFATVGADGTPHITPVWYVFDGDDFLFTAERGTAKVSNVQRNPRAAICLDDETPPYAYVEVRGDVTLSEDLDELSNIATRAGAGYLGAAGAEEFGERNSVPGMVVVRLHATKVVAYSGITD